MLSARKLISVKCPFSNISKYDNRVYPCKKLCIKVNAGSSGEAFCARCKRTFLFEIKDNEVFTKIIVRKT